MTFKEEWAPLFRGRRVPVIYDAGDARDAAYTAAGKLRAAGADAWVVDLASAGLKKGEDITDWFVTYGRNKADLIDLILSEKAKNR
jgi:hypothetical protein